MQPLDCICKRQVQSLACTRASDQAPQRLWLGPGRVARPVQTAPPMAHTIKSHFLLLALALMSTSCTVGISPPSSGPITSPASQQLLQDLGGTYCFCSLDQNLRSPHQRPYPLAQIPVASLEEGSLIEVDVTGEPPTHLSLEFSLTDSGPEKLAFNLKDQPCNFDQDKIRCKRDVEHGASLGIGSHRATTDFYLSESGDLHIADFYRECGLGLLVIPFCESNERSLELQRVSNQAECECGGAAQKGPRLVRDGA